MGPASGSLATGVLEEVGDAGAVALHGAREVAAEEPLVAVGPEKLDPLRSRLRRVALGPGESIPHHEEIEWSEATARAARIEGYALC
jgi:hypothetical protein